IDPLSESQIANAMALLLGQPALRSRLRAKGIERAQSFTWEGSAGAIWAEMQALLPARAAVRKPSPTESPRSDRQIPILGLPIDNLSWQDTLHCIESMVEAGGVHQVATANPEFLMRARREPAFMNVLRNADLVLADG